MQLAITIPRVMLGICAVAAIGLFAISAKERRMIADLRAENARLAAEAKEADRLRQQLAATESLRNQESEIERLREENQDLFRLRNEVHQLREQQNETEVLRAANTQLLQMLQEFSLSSNQQVRLAMVRSKGAVLGLILRPANDPANLQSPQTGAVVIGIDSSSPVAATDIKPGDVVVALDGRPITSSGQLQAEMLTRKPGETVTLGILRNGSVLQIAVRTRGWPQ